MLALHGACGGAVPPQCRGSAPRSSFCRKWAGAARSEGLPRAGEPELGAENAVIIPSCPPGAETCSPAPAGGLGDVDQQIKRESLQPAVSRICNLQLCSPLVRRYPQVGALSEGRATQALVAGAWHPGAGAGARSAQRAAWL